LVNGFAAGLLCRRLLQNVALNGEVAFVDLCEANPTGLIGGDFRILEPIAAGVLVKIHAGVGSLINVGDAEAGGHWRRRLCERRNSGKQHSNSHNFDWMHDKTSRSGLPDWEFYGPPIGRARPAEVTALFS